MQSSLPTGQTDQNIKAVDPAKFAEIAKIVGRATPQAVLVRSILPVYYLGWAR
jgi:hypothetical protein